MVKKKVFHICVLLVIVLLIVETLYIVHQHYVKPINSPHDEYTIESPHPLNWEYATSQAMDYYVLDIETSVKIANILWAKSYDSDFFNNTICSVYELKNELINDKMYDVIVVERSPIITKEKPVLGGVVGIAFNKLNGQVLNEWITD